MARCAGCAGCNCVVDGVTITGAGVLGNPFVAVGGGGGSGGPPLEGTYYVAANDARPQIKAMADFVCDGVADEVQIQAAIDAIIGLTPHGRGVVSLSEGNFILSNSINLNNTLGFDNFVVIRGAGPGGGDFDGPPPPTTINRSLTMTVPAFLLTIAAVTSFINLGFQDNLSTTDKDPMISFINDNATIVVEHCFFYPPTSTSFPTPLARCISGTPNQFKLRNSSFSRSPGACVALSRVYQIEITSNYFYTGHSDGGAFGANEYVIILEGNAPAGEGADWPTIISHNFSDGNQRGTIQLIGMAQVIVSDNVFLYDNNDPSILIDQCYEIQVNSNQLGGGNGETIKATASTYLQINDNQIIESGTDAISLSGTNDSQINNNSIVAGANAASSGILIDADSNTNMVTGNLIRGTTLYGIRVNNANCDDNLVTNNDLKNSATTPFSDIGTGTIITAGNRF